jgi:hypothetical protein
MGELAAWPHAVSSIPVIYYLRMIFSDLPSPAEASGRLDGLHRGFAQAGNRCTLFRIMR